MCLGCGPQAPARKETSKVTGKVVVDGKPAAFLQITCHDKLGIDKADPTFSAGRTDAEGKFELYTYQMGDGVPPGSYTMTFMWGQISQHTMQYGGPDKLKDQYSDPKTSKFEFTVESGEAKDLGTIELTIKPNAPDKPKQKETSGPLQ